MAQKAQAGADGEVDAPLSCAPLSDFEPLDFALLLFWICDPCLSSLSITCLALVPVMCQSPGDLS